VDELRTFQDAQPELERWRLRQVKNPPEQPEPGSELAGDDQAFRYQRISETVRLSLISAGEHLRLVWDGLIRHNLYGTAQHTAVRGALVGAAQAVWITAPDDAGLRQRRGLTVIAESYKQLRNYHGRTLEVADLLGLTSEQQQVARDQIASITEREQALAAVRSTSGKLNITEVVRDVAPVVFPQDTERQGGLRLAWNALSCDAHSLMWNLITRADFRSAGPPDRATGLSVGIVRGQFGDLAGWYGLTMTTLRRGWSLYDRRCEGR
jgi:hypothetical protein